MKPGVLKSAMLVVSAAVWLAAGAVGAQPGSVGDRQAAAGLRVGESAPDFQLRTMDGRREVRLSSFKGQKPVVLVFGSFT